MNGTAVIGWHPEIPEELAELLRKAVYWNDQARSAKDARQRRRAHGKKHFYVLKAHEKYPRYFLTLRRYLRKGDGKMYVDFVPKTGAPKGRTRFLVPVGAIRRNEGWERQCAQALSRPPRYRRIKARDCRPWPEDQEEQPVIRRGRIKVTPPRPRPVAA